jgi:hypothetical protein
MQPLGHELIRVDLNQLNRPDRADLGTIEFVSTSSRFTMDRCEIRIDGESRVRMRLEAIKLGMIGIAVCCATKDGSRQQRLAPQSD